MLDYVLYYYIHSKECKFFKKELKFVNINLNTNSTKFLIILK